MRIDFRWHAYKYLPYEQVLAGRELAALFGRPPVPYADGLRVEVNETGTNHPVAQWQAAARRTTYFCEAVASTGERVIPQQAILEASVNGGFQSPLPGLEITPVLRRQSTRYGAHGLHEYRGKFNPQIVRAIGNLLNLSPGTDWLLDPFCGSGTTLLEAAHNGWNAVGLDINPLGVEIARAKLAALHIAPQDLLTLSETVSRNLSRQVAGISLDDVLDAKQMRRLGGRDWETTLPNLEYLREWFMPSVLVQIAAILGEIAHVSDWRARIIFRTVLSDILREVSLQEPADLRIRRRKSPPLNMPVIPLFTSTLSARIEAILKTYQVFPPHPATVQDVLLGDVREAAHVVGQVYPQRQFDAAITSPPYVTALPYIDTQRLSLAVLGLIDAAEIRAAERRLIGNREITNQRRQELNNALHDNAAELPESCWRLCCDLAAAVDPQRDGFRRQNQPGLVYQYFADMACMFGQVRALLRPGARYVLVVGANRTRLGGRKFVIDTPHLLAAVAEQHGFSLEEALELNTYQRFDVHQANSVRSETMLILKTVTDAC